MNNYLNAQLHERPDISEQTEGNFKITDEFGATSTKKSYMK